MNKLFLKIVRRARSLQRMSRRLHLFPPPERKCSAPGSGALDHNAQDPPSTRRINPAAAGCWLVLIPKTLSYNKPWRRWRLEWLRLAFTQCSFANNSCPSRHTEFSHDCESASEVQSAGDSPGLYPDGAPPPPSFICSFPPRFCEAFPKSMSVPEQSGCDTPLPTPKELPLCPWNCDPVKLWSV
jgi:hypothetical protein